MKPKRKRLRRISEAEKKELLARKDTQRSTFRITVGRSDIRHESYRGTTSYTGTTVRVGEDGLPYNHTTVVQQSSKKRAVNRNKMGATVERFMRDDYRSDNLPRLEDGTIVHVKRKRKTSDKGEKFTVSEYEILMATLADENNATVLGNAEAGTQGKISNRTQRSEKRWGTGNIWGF